jgi:hypothetical protein
MTNALFVSQDQLSQDWLGMRSGQGAGPGLLWIDLGENGSVIPRPKMR